MMDWLINSDWNSLSRGIAFGIVFISSIKLKKDGYKLGDLSPITFTAFVFLLVYSVSG